MLLLLQFGAVNLALQLSDPHSFWRPFLDALPSPDELLCPLVSMPHTYLPLLSSKPLVSAERQARLLSTALLMLNV